MKEMETKFLSKEQIEFLLDGLREGTNVYKLIIDEQKEYNEVYITIAKIDLDTLYKAKEQIMNGSDLLVYSDYMNTDVINRENKLIIANSLISTQTRFHLIEYKTQEKSCMNKALNVFLRDMFSNMYPQKRKIE